MKKIFLLLFASVLVFSCTKDVELADSTADLSSTLAQYDDTNMGVYKGLFTTVGTMERGTIEINITPNNYGVATLKLVDGQVISFKADRKVAAGAELQDLQFNSSSVMASFKLSADLDGNNVEIRDVVYKGITSGAIAAHETSRAPVTPITGVLACDDCDAHPLLVTGDTGTFSLLFVGDGSADDTVTAIADVGAVVSTGGSQSACVDGGFTTTCDISGGGTIGSNLIGYVGTHTFNNGGDCSAAMGTWSLDSGNHGAYTGTFVSDDSCAVPANDLCVDAEAVTCGMTYTGSTATATDETGTNGNDVFYSYTDAGVAQIVTVSLCDGGTTYDSLLRVLDGCSGTEVASNDDSCGLQSELTFTSDGTSTYIIIVEAFSTGSGPYSMAVTCVDAPPPPTGCLGTTVDFVSTSVPFDIDGVDTSTADCVGAPNLVPTTVGVTGTIGAEYGIDNVAIDITHTWSGDMEISLVAPSGTELLMWDNVGGSGDDFTGTVFQDGGADSTGSTAPHTGTFAPVGGTFAAAFAGESVAGDWMLKMCDTAGGDSGTLNAFTLTLCDNPAPLQNTSTNREAYVNRTQMDKAEYKRLKGIK